VRRFTRKLIILEQSLLILTVKQGDLKNGLTYYIKKCQARIKLRLVVSAGSILGNEQQVSSYGAYVFYGTNHKTN
jgi:predicted Zn-dependent peptidase